MAETAANYQFDLWWLKMPKLLASGTYMHILPEPWSDIPDTFPDRIGQQKYKTGHVSDIVRTGPDTFRTWSRIEMSSFKSDTIGHDRTLRTPIGHFGVRTPIGHIGGASSCHVGVKLISPFKFQSKGTLLMRMMGDSVIWNLQDLPQWSVTSTIVL